VRRLVAAYRHPARHRAGTIRPWPRTPAVDPWAGQPLFHPTHELRTAAAQNVTCGRTLKIGVTL
jgi:hypothetical protein